MSFQGVQIDIPSANERPIEKTVFQMTYLEERLSISVGQGEKTKGRGMTHQRNVSRKKRARSMMNMMVRVNAAWLRQRALPKYLSEHCWTCMCAMTLIGSRNESVRKKYDSVN